MGTKRRIAVTSTLFLTLLISGLFFWLSGGHAYASANNAVQYANTHWNCANAACTSTVSSGSGQPNFQCAEFVARSLAAAGLVPGLTSGSSQSSYGNYTARNGKKYDLLWVGWTSSGGYNTGINGIYQYMTQNGVGVDVGNNPGRAGLGDVVIYHHSNGHTALLVQIGGGLLVDAHNNARYHVPYTEYSDLTIVHVSYSGTVPPPPPTPVGSWPTEQMGSTGNNVTSVQLMLAAHGYSLSIDGDFGPQTQTTVRNFQSAHGLTVDGIVGPQTWSALIVSTQQGSSGSAVTALQRQLNAHGASLTVDGSFGPLTNTAVRNYQSHHGLGVDGIAGPLTWRSLVS